MDVSQKNGDHAGDDDAPQTLITEENGPLIGEDKVDQQYKTNSGGGTNAVTPSLIELQ